MTDDEFRQYFHDEPEGVRRRREAERSVGRRWRASLGYIAGEMDDPGAVQAAVRQAGGESALPDGVLFYLAIPPTVYGTVDRAAGRRLA